MEIYGETREMLLEKIIFSAFNENIIEPHSIDLIILHSSYTEQFAKELEIFAKNVITISSNVYSKDTSVEHFNKFLFTYLLEGEKISYAYEKAMSKI